MSASPVVGAQETTYRAFAAEFDDASLPYSESDEERTSNYVVTPTGARLSRMFVVGVFTEVEYVNDRVLRGRIADPTGAFVTYAEQYQPESMAYLDAVISPVFASLASKARIYEPDDADVVYSSVRPESVNTVDADVRDRWIISVAEVTFRRIAVFGEVLLIPYRGDDLTCVFEARGVDSTLVAGVPCAIDHYGTTRTYLEALREVTMQALKFVAGDHDQVDPLDVAPDGGGDAVLGPFPELDLEPAASVDIEVGEAGAGGVKADADEFENESGSKPAATFDSGPEFDSGAEPGATEPESESEPITEPDSEPESTSDPEPIAAETTAVAEGQSGASEPESASKPPTTVDSEPEPEPAVEPESEPAAGPDLTSKPEPKPVTDPLDTESEPDSDDGVFGDSEDDASDTGATDTSLLDDPGSRTLGDFDGGFDDPDLEASDSTDSTDSAYADVDDSVDSDGIYKLDEDERAEIESEFGTEFTSGADVDPASEVDIGAPDADGLAEQLEDESAAVVELDPGLAITAAGPEPTVGSKPEPTPDVASDGDEDEADADPDTDEFVENIGFKSVVVDTMDGLDDGDGATRDEVVAVVVDEHNADPGAVEGAIQEAFLDGWCCKPQDDVLRAI